MSGIEPRPLFVDTGAFFAYYYERASRHDISRAAFTAIRDGELLYRPLYTSRHVLAELTALLARKATHEAADRALREIRGASDIHVLVPDVATFDASCKKFSEYDDQNVTLVDHIGAVLAEAYDIEHVFAFDSDFRTLGFTLVPEDTGEVDLSKKK